MPDLLPSWRANAGVRLLQSVTREGSGEATVPQKKAVAVAARSSVMEGVECGLLRPGADARPKAVSGV